MAKKNGVKANIRSSEIIELLVNLSIDEGENSQNINNITTGIVEMTPGKKFEELLMIVSNSPDGCMSYSSLKRNSTLKSLFGQKLKDFLLQAVDDKFLLCTEVKTLDRNDELGFRITTKGQNALRVEGEVSSARSTLYHNQLRQALAQARRLKKKKSDDWHVVESKSKPGKFFKYNKLTKSSVWLN